MYPGDDIITAPVVETLHYRVITAKINNDIYFDIMRPNKTHTVQ